MLFLKEQDNNNKWNIVQGNCSFPTQTKAEETVIILVDAINEIFVIDCCCEIQTQTFIQYN